MNNKWNKLYLGLTIGLVIPLVVAFLDLIYYAHRVSYTIPEFLKIAISTKGFLPNIMLSSLINLIPFYLFLKKEYYKSIRGIIFATLIIAIFVYSINFFF